MFSAIGKRSRIAAAIVTASVVLVSVVTFGPSSTASAATKSCPGGGSPAESSASPVKGTGWTIKVTVCYSRLGEDYVRVHSVSARTLRDDAKRNPKGEPIAVGWTFAIKRVDPASGNYVISKQTRSISPTALFSWTGLGTAGVQNAAYAPKVEVTVSRAGGKTVIPELLGLE